MKNLILGTALALSGLSVVIPTNQAMAQEVASVGNVGSAINWFAKRIYSLEVGTLAYEMEQDGVKSRDYVAVFSLSGALIQNYELSGSRVGLEKVGRNVGFQILPYKVSISSDGRKFLSVAAAAFGNMNKAYRTVGTMERYYKDRGDVMTDKVWTFINKIEGFVYEYDENMTSNNIVTHRLSIVKAEAKLDILGSSTPGHFLAVVGRLGAGFENQIITTPNEMINVGNKGGEGILPGRSIHEKLEAGLEYNVRVGKGSNLNISTMFSWQRYDGFNHNKEDRLEIERINSENESIINNENSILEAQFNNELEIYQNNKADYEAQNLDGQVVSDETYQELSGAQYPAVPEYAEFEAQNYSAPEVTRTLMYLRPNIKFNGRLSRNTRYELNVFGNIPIKDNVKGGGLNLDLSGTNARPIVGAGIKVKF